MIPAPVQRYLERLQPTTDAVQKAMEREGAKRNFPIIGPLVGSLCSQWARAVGARRVFEMGSGFGYSTLHFARAVGPGGRVVHTDGSPDLSAEAKRWLGKAGLAGRVDFRVGDAMELLRRDGGTYDAVFIDVDKEGYPEAWEVARRRVRRGGVILTDNALWMGRVATAARDAATRGVKEYNRLAFCDPAFQSTIVPIRDGVTVSLRLAEAAASGGRRARSRAAPPRSAEPW